MIPAQHSTDRSDQILSALRRHSVDGRQEAPSDPHRKSVRSKQVAKQEVLLEMKHVFRCETKNRVPITRT